MGYVDCPDWQRQVTVNPEVVATLPTVPTSILDPVICKGNHTNSTEGTASWIMYTNNTSDIVIFRHIIMRRTSGSSSTLFITTATPTAQCHIRDIPDPGQDISCEVHEDTVVHPGCRVIGGGEDASAGSTFNYQMSGYATSA